MDRKQKSALIQESSDLKDKILAGGISRTEKSALIERRSEIKDLIFGRKTLQEKEPQDSELVKQYKAFKFSDLPEDEFIEIVRNVHSEGLELTPIIYGMEDWLKVNGFAA